VVVLACHLSIGRRLSIRSWPWAKSETLSEKKKKGKSVTALA
jgi:hypothetical protein